jgi:WD40 repeat protein
MGRHVAHLVTVMLAWLVCTPALLPQPRVDALGDPLPEGARARLGTTRMRHFSTPDHHCWGLRCLAWSSDGKIIASSSYSDDIGLEARLWEASTGKPLSLLENNTRFGPHFIRFTPDNKTLAAAARDTIILWDVGTGKELGQLVGHQSDIDTLVFQDGGKTMISVSRDGDVRWWDIAGRKTVRQWRLPADDPKETDEGAPILLRGIRDTCFSPDGRFLAVAKWWTATSKKPLAANAAIVVDLHARKVIWRRDGSDFYCFAFAPDGKRLAMKWAGLVRLLETTTGRELARSGWLWPSGMEFSPDGKSLAICSNGKVSFWSPDDKTSLRVFEVPMDGGGYNTFHASPAFSPDGMKLAIDRKGTFQVLDVATGKPAVSWPSYDETFRNLEFAPDGRTLRADRLSIDTATWRARAQPEDLLDDKFDRLQAVSKDRALCVAADGKHRDSLFDVKSGRMLAHLQAPEVVPGPHGGVFSPKATLYLMRDRSCDGKEVDTLFAIPSGKRLWQVSFHDLPQTCCWSFSGDESRVVFFESGTGVVQVRATASGKLLWQFATGGEEGTLALSPDGNLLAVWREGLRDMRILDMRTGRHRGWLALDQHARRLDRGCLAWSPDNRMLAVGGLDDSVRLWEVASGQARREFKGHRAPVTCLAFSGDGRLLASGSDDTTLLIWTVVPEQ